MRQFIAARCVAPAHTACCDSDSGAIATEDDVLTLNCWDACWDEMPLPATPEPSLTHAYHQVIQSSPHFEKSITLAK